MAKKTDSFARRLAKKGKKADLRKDIFAVIKEDDSYSQEQLERLFSLNYGELWALWRELKGDEKPPCGAPTMSELNAESMKKKFNG